MYASSPLLTQQRLIKKQTKPVPETSLSLRPKKDGIENGE